MLSPVQELLKEGCGRDVIKQEVATTENFYKQKLSTVIKLLLYIHVRRVLL